MDKNTVLKTLDLLYEWLDGEMRGEDAAGMKEALFDWFFEYGNGGRDETYRRIREQKTISP